MADKSSKSSGENTVIVITEKAELKTIAPKHEPYLIQISGRETGQMHPLKGRRVRIGREPQCEIVLDDPHISRNHAEVQSFDDGKIVLRDLGSTNGIFVNGVRVQEQQLQDGDKILIGTRMYFKFEYQDAQDTSYQQNLFRAANIDNLTQLYNKKYFIDTLSKEFSFSRRNRQPLSLMMIDIDHFKKVNDTHGHVAGDHVLRSLGTYLLKHLRLENIGARYGGEEFAVILRNVASPLAFTIAERLRKAIEADPIQYRSKAIPITISVGIATFENGNFQTLEDLIQKADECLYEAKAAGRNRTMAKAA